MSFFQQNVPLSVLSEKDVGLVALRLKVMLGNYEVVDNVTMVTSSCFPDSFIHEWILNGTRYVGLFVG